MFWIFVSYAIGAILTDFFVSKLKVNWFDDLNYLSDRMTRNLGVLAFGWLVKNTFMGWFNKKLRLKASADKNDLTQLKQEMRNAEAGHLIAFYFLFGVNGYMAYLGLEWWYIVLFFLINVVFNLYLVFLQQYNKRRIDRLIASNSSK